MTVTLPARSPKAPGMTDRCFSLEHTLALIPLLRSRYGITRVADITQLDRSGIPAASAIVPDSPDLLSVYNGKGLTLDAARCSAVMEAFERQAAAAPGLEQFDLSADEVQAQFDIDAMGLRPNKRNRRVTCVRGTDLQSGTEVAVPLALVQCPWFGERHFKVTSTNGLASGNSMAEAVYHALCELIERHTWSMYHARSHLVPQVFFGAGASDVGLAREVVFPTGDATVDALAERVAAAGLRLRALFLREDPLPPAMVATVLERETATPVVHMGFGSSLSPAHALARAITEAIQSRLVDIQGAREDIVREDDPKTNLLDHARRTAALPDGRWYFDGAAETIELRTIGDAASDDLAADVRSVLSRLRAAGAGPVIAIDLSPRDLPLHAVRMIVPGLESTVVDGRIGAKIRGLLNPFRVPA